MKIIFQLLLVLCTFSAFSQSNSNTEYFRHLRYNHISPFVDILGIHPIDESTAKSTSHYVFKYDASGRLSEILNNHYHTEKKHALASIGVYKVKIDYVEGKEVRTFYDPNGKRVSNDRDVYKEVYTYNQNDFKTKLQFYNLDDQAMETNWAVAEYHWVQEVSFVIERRFNLKNESVNVSPYFEFGTTGIHIDSMGLANGHFNLNDKLEVSNNSIGIASYQDSYDNDGNHVKYSYYNANDSLALNQWQFAVGVKSYDKLGNHILLEQFDTNGKLVSSRPVYSNSSIELSPLPSSQDSTEIKKQSLGYLKALQELDPVLMNEVMNDSLKKITIGYNRDVRREVARPTTRSQMIAFAEDWNKSHTKFPPIPSDEVAILSIYNRIASVKLVSDNWVEYLHLIKLDGKWEIANLIWQHKDVSRYPK